MKMQILEEDDDLAYSSTPDEEQKVVDGRPTWMKTLHTSVSTWMTLVPKVRQTFLMVYFYFQMFVKKKFYFFFKLNNVMLFVWLLI